MDVHIARAELELRKAMALMTFDEVMGNSSLFAAHCIVAARAGDSRTVDNPCFFTKEILKKRTTLA